jgi:hypothetical protein
MILCAVCTTGMRCTKTGIVVRWGGIYAKRGDRYQCPVCMAEVVCIADRADGYEDGRPAEKSTDTYLEIPQ